MEQLAADEAIDRAIAFHRAGHRDAAAAAYRAILTDHPAQPDALHLLGMLACDDGAPDDALDLIDSAISHEPGRAAFHNTRARALMALARWAEAEAAYRTAWELRPDAAEIANNLACLLRDRGDITGAVAAFTRASTLAPGSAEIAANLACALAAQGARAASVMQFEHALLLDPHSADIHYKFGHLLASFGRHIEAAAQFRACLNIDPAHAASHNNLGLAHQAQGDGVTAARCFHTAIRHDPECADAHYNLGCLFQLDNRTQAARGCYEAAVQADTLHGAALWARAMVDLPILYESTAQLAPARAAYAKALAKLADMAEIPAIAQALSASIGSSQPFFLPYQGQDDLELQRRYGALLARLAPTGAPPGARLAEPPLPGEQIRIGIVSAHFCEHTIWRLMLKGWLAEIDRDRFAITAYHTGPCDAQTEIARAFCPRLHIGSGGEIRTAILADRPHVLLYPEFGIDPACARLGAERLAPVQCVAWGQPQTSGLPTMDFFISSALMEPANAAARYSENLVALPGIGIHYLADERTAAPCTRADFGLRADSIMFWCGQALYKYLPAHDDVFARIAAALGNCQFVFIGFAKSAAVTAQFQARLNLAFAAYGLDAQQFCVIAEPMSHERYLGGAALADIVLDSIGWSGGKSTLGMLAVSPVIVTLAGDLMRGRHTAAILAATGVPDTIVDTTEEYIALAVRLAHNPQARAELRTRLAAGRSRVIANPAPVRALETVLARAALGG